MEEKMGNMDVGTALTDLDRRMKEDEQAELARLFALDDNKTKEQEMAMSKKDLEGFANGFPDWDLHPVKG